MTKIPLHIGRQAWQFGMSLDTYHERVEILQDLFDVDNKADVWAFRFGLRCPFSGRFWHIRPPGGAPCPCGYVFRYNPPTGGGGNDVGLRYLPRQGDIEVFLDDEQLSVLSSGKLNGGPDGGLLQVYCTRRPRKYDLPQRKTVTHAIPPGVYAGEVTNTTWQPEQLNELKAKHRAALDQAPDPEDEARDDGPVVVG